MSRITLKQTNMIAYNIICDISRFNIEEISRVAFTPRKRLAHPRLFMWRRLYMSKNETGRYQPP